MIKAMLTTVDNPYNPFDDWANWLAFDVAHRHDSMGMLARIAVLSDELSEADYNVAVTNAIDEIVLINVTGLYRKVEREFPDS